MRLERTVFLSGDVMTGRGIDQILPHRGDPRLRESVVRDARDYVTLAERANGPVPVPVGFDWPWGEALPLLEHFMPDVRLINLETTITDRGEFAAGKAVHYRMHPANIRCLSAIRPDVCALANNHVLDFGYHGLADTVDALGHASIHGVGAGMDAAHANRPAVVTLADGARVVIVSCGMPSSGIPRHWAATADRPGVALLPDLSDRSADEITERLLAQCRPGDTTIVSLHWGSNWGYEVHDAQIRFARRLIDGGVDVVHGHSSHHPRPVEVYRGKLILYGCGDTIDDYEGIRTYEAFRHELRLLYFVSLESDTGALTTLRMMPMRMRRLRLDRVSHDQAEWLRVTMEQISQQFGTRVREMPDGALAIVS